MKSIAIYGHWIRQSPGKEVLGGWGGRLEALHCYCKGRTTLCKGSCILSQGSAEMQTALKATKFELGTI